MEWGTESQETIVKALSWAEEDLIKNTPQIINIVQDKSKE
jgi:hypothetical protein